MASIAKAIAQDTLKEAGQGIAKKATEQAQNIAITTALKQAPGGALLSSIYTSFKDVGRKIKDLYTSLSPSTKLIFFGVLVIVISVTVLSIYFSRENETTEQQIAATASRVNENAATLGQLKAGLAVVGLTEGFQDCPVQATATKEEIKLINLQPFSVKHTGFKGIVSSDGTSVDSGAFDVADAVRKSLQAGIRTFVLQIDYMETDRTADGFPAAQEPCLLYKDTAGILKSTNAGSIRTACQTLVDNAFVATLPQKDDPIVVILYVVRTPVSDVENPVEYLQYLSKIAAQLEPLKTRHLALTDKGDFTKQSNEKDILTLPINEFQRKIIVATNADTSAFRKQEALNLTIETMNNLDYWSNLRIFKNDPNASLGVTRVPVETQANFVLLSQGQVEIALQSTEGIKSMSESLKGKFSMMLASPEKNPDTAVVDKALDQIGINIIPLDIFTFSTAVTIASSIPWKTNSWKLKPALLR